MRRSSKRVYKERVFTHPPTPLFLLAAEAVSQRTSMSHTEKCQGQAFFLLIVYVVIGGMCEGNEEV